MRVSNLDSAYPILRRTSTEVGFVNNAKRTERTPSVSIDIIYNDLIEQRDKSLPKPGKGFYIIINYPNSNSAKRVKRCLSPLQERINKTYQLISKKETGLLVDMIV